MSQPDRMRDARKIVSAARVVIETASMPASLFTSDDQQYLLVRSVERLVESIEAYPPTISGIDDSGTCVCLLGGVASGIRDRWYDEEADALYERAWKKVYEDRANPIDEYSGIEYPPEDCLDGCPKPPPPYADPIFRVTAEEIGRLIPNRLDNYPLRAAAQ